MNFFSKILQFFTNLFNPKAAEIRAAVEKNQDVDNRPTPEPIKSEPPPQPKESIGLEFAYQDGEYSRLLASARISHGHSAVIADCQRILANRSRYEAIGTVPWFVVGVIHLLEASLNFHTCLHNGDPLPGPTVHVPRGRGPFSSWEEAARDALHLDGADKHKVWDIENTLSFLEHYNGMGYRNHGINSPYLWSFTNQYSKGKYVADGVWSSAAVSQQVGACAIFLGMKELGVHLEGLMV